jgi:hypothetical protein
MIFHLRAFRNPEKWATFYWPHYVAFGRITASSNVFLRSRTFLATQWFVLMEKIKKNSPVGAPDYHGLRKSQWEIIRYIYIMV